MQMKREKEDGKKRDPRSSEKAEKESAGRNPEGFSGAPGSGQLEMEVRPENKKENAHWIRKKYRSEEAKIHREAEVSGAKGKKSRIELFHDLDKISFPPCLGTTS